MTEHIHHPVVRSMQWSVYADALGFMSELVDRSGLTLRTGRDSVSGIAPWTYKIGGRFGIEIPMPAGMYSDDTQLRLATCRAIGRGGSFNVEAFAKIELPVWLSYALGGGKGTKAAATNLSRDNISWCSNFYNSGEIRYLESGGNGAAMRIQPHVWSSNPNSDVNELLLNVTRNTITTHGHPRALVGALLHALVLHDTLHSGVLAPPDHWINLLSQIKTFPGVISKDEYLGVIWLTDWQRQCGSFSDAILQTVEECIQDIKEFGHFKGNRPESDYPEFLRKIGGMDRSMRGSGTKTVIASLALAWMFQHDAEKGVLISANTLGSDTDTIGTMAGALLGIISHTRPAREVTDAEMLSKQAERLIDIAKGLDVPDFSYPSLLTWKPPRTASDSVGRIGNAYGIVGLGALEAIDDKIFETREKQPSAFRWTRTTFGQTILAKMRQEPQELTMSQMPQTQVPLRQYSPSSRPTGEQALRRPLPQQDRLATLGTHSPESQPLLPFSQVGVGENFSQNTDLDHLTNTVIRSGFAPQVIGEAFLSICNGEKAIENGIAFAAILAKAKIARRGR